MTVKRALKELNVANELVHCLNGLEALEYLRNQGGKKPCLILLDLNMPKMNGIDFLKTVKADDNLKNISVVILTTSGNEKDIIDSFNLNIAGYIVKPVDYEKFVEAVKTIDQYWTLSELPEED